MRSIEVTASGVTLDGLKIDGNGLATRKTSA